MPATKRSKRPSSLLLWNAIRALGAACSDRDRGKAWMTIERQICLLEDMLRDC